jgi:hypothetical protein
MENITPYEMITQVLEGKSSMKQDVYQNTLAVFNQFKEEIKGIADQLNNDISKKDQRLIIEYKEKGEFEAELKFAGDVLIFYMHTNVFKFDEEHGISKTPYAQEDERRRFCGIISIYNFLSDSFKYKRVNDLGYMIGRIFVNRDNHFMVEGKRQLGFLYDDFANAVMEKEAIRAIIESSIIYTLEFDLLTPPYDVVKEVSVMQIQEATNYAMLKTAKRMGFSFQSGHDKIK